MRARLQGVKVGKTDEFKYLRSVIQGNRQYMRGDEENAGEVETSVTGDL